VLGLLPLLYGLVLISRAAIGLGSDFLRFLLDRTRNASWKLAAGNLTRNVTRTSLTVCGFGVSLSFLIALASIADGSSEAGVRWARSLMPGAFAIVSPVDQPLVFIPRFETLAGVSHASPVSFLQTISTGTPVQLAAVEPEVQLRGLEFVEGTPTGA